MVEARRPRPSPLLDAFSGWLQAFGDAWEATDADALAELFALGATMQPTPFAELVRGRRLIRDHWQAELGGSTEVQFRAQVLGVGDTYGVAHWRVSLVPASGRRARLRDGIMLVAMNSRGQCTSLRQWSHETETGTVSEPGGSPPQAAPNDE